MLRAAVEGFLPVVGVPGERLYIYGVDFLTDFAIREHQFAQAQLVSIKRWILLPTRIPSRSPNLLRAAWVCRWALD